MTERSTLYFELREVLDAGGCPICRLGRRAGDSYLRALIYEGVTDPGLRQHLRNARGLCHRHGWRLAEQRGSVLGVAIIYHDIINTLTKILEAEEAQGARRQSNRQALASRLGPSAECPACRLEMDAIPRAAKTLLKYLDDPEIASRFQHAGGLCLPHLQTVLTQANGTQAHTVANWQQSIYRELRDQLAELIRKNDHRFQGEPIGEERDSWQRAIARITGEQDK